MAQTLETTLRNPQTDVEREIAALGPWFHNLHLPGGVQTAPDHALGDFPAFKWRALAPHLPEDLRGWTALDIGCNAGFYSFELARRGADVTAIDPGPRYLEQARWAAQRLGLAERVRFRAAQVYDLVRWGEKYDLVLFMGVFYHLRYPFLALDIVARATRRRLVFQTLTTAGRSPHADLPDLPLEERQRITEPDWPQMSFIERRLQGDPTNWWVPNEPAVEAMLRSVGLRIIARPGHEILVCEPDETFSSETRDFDELQFRSATGA